MVKEPTEMQQLARELVARSTPAEQKALLDAVLGGRIAEMIGGLRTEPTPSLRPPPVQVTGYRIRLDLVGVKPPIWRRLLLPGDLTLPRVHTVIQAAMGWTDSHLHRFRTGSDDRSPYFLTPFDVEEGESGLLENDVRLDQVLETVGDTLWYEYDFGDGWDHVLRVEQVLDERPPSARCLAGRLACPPEDSHGPGGYQDLATWVRSGYDDNRLPTFFENAEHARAWLPVDWHPDRFDLVETNEALSIALADSPDVPAELAELLSLTERSGYADLRRMVVAATRQGLREISAPEAERMTESYRILLDLVGDGVALTSAGYLPPDLVEQLAQRTGITSWWIGKANREDLTPPVAQIRDTARALGLVTVRRGRLTPTAAGARVRTDAQALLRHVLSRLPLGTRPFDRHAGWFALTLAACGAPIDSWYERVGDLLHDAGWRSAERGWHDMAHPPTSPTLFVLRQLAGDARIGVMRASADRPVALSSVADAARSVILRS